MSNVDAETEALMSKVIAEEWAGKTVIAVVHKLDSVVKEGVFDKVIGRDGGKVIEVGEPKVLMMRDGGAFRGLYEGNQ